MFQMLPRRRFSAVASLAALAAALCGGTARAQTAQAPLFDQLPDDIKARKVIRVAGDVYAPYRIAGEDGKTLTGLDADLLAAMEPLLGVKFEQTIVSTQLAMLTGIETGRYDFSMGPLMASRPREERYDIIAWLLSKPAFIVPASRKTSKLEDLCGLRIAYPAGTAQETTSRMLSDRCTSQGLPAMQLVPMSDQNVTVLSMQSGRADTTGMQLAAGLYLAQQNPGKFHVQTDQTDGLGILYQGALVKKGSPLGPVMQEAFKRIHASGEYDRILAKYGLGPARQPEIIMNPASKGLTASSPVR
jgi:polar amino acid transport system substrate-binding protein